jgi:hypothetical protein
VKDRPISRIPPGDLSVSRGGGGGRGTERRRETREYDRTQKFTRQRAGMKAGRGGSCKLFTVPAGHRHRGRRRRHRHSGIRLPVCKEGIQNRTGGGGGGACIPALDLFWRRHFCSFRCRTDCMPANLAFPHLKNLMKVQRDTLCTS